MLSLLHNSYAFNEIALLNNQVTSLPTDGQFLVHVGDINKANLKTSCYEENYTTLKTIMLNAPNPVFVLAGDNDIVDCPNPIQGNIFWQKHLSRFELNWSSSASQYPFLSQVQRQPNRDENFAFYFRGVLFFGIDMVQPQNPLDAYDENLITTPTNGTSKSLAYTTVSDDLAWTRKMMQELPAAADDEPLSHIVIFSHAQPNTVRDRAFFDEMKLDIEALIVPCLYIHGNGHVWEYEQNAFGINSILRVQVDRGGIAAPVKVQVGGTDASTPFTFTRRAVNA